MTKHRAKRSVWDRGEQEPLPETARAAVIRQLQGQKVLTVQEAATYLRVNKPMIENFIKRGVLELVPTAGRPRLVSMQCLRGLIMPVRSLNKRLQLLEEMKAEVNEKIKRKQEQLKKLDDENNRN